MFCMEFSYTAIQVLIEFICLGGHCKANILLMFFDTCFRICMECVEIFLGELFHSFKGLESCSI